MKAEPLLVTTPPSHPRQTAVTTGATTTERAAQPLGPLKPPTHVRTRAGRYRGSDGRTGPHSNGFSP
ncbi:hypothetical protein FFG40_002940 [Curtobacterium sp. KBS0715]|nr:hypothetical protein FFG40_002940 [Curtobacterium sp. KBS0715]